MATAKGRWTDEEHQRFLQGLREHGKGQWKIIAEEVVKTRSTEQVRIHASKYYTRQEKAAKRQSSGTGGGKFHHCHTTGTFFSPFVCAA